MKRTLLYTALGVCFLSACSTDEWGPSGTADNESGLQLTVSACDFMLSDDICTRAADKGNETSFESGDRVGVIILDESGNILVDNAPFIYDSASKKWSFDNGGNESNTPAYYHPDMNTCIVYYPYDESAAGQTTTAGLKALDVFKVQADQSMEEAYRHADLMIYMGQASKEIKAELSHARASFSLAATAKWKLGNKTETAYPIQSIDDVLIYTESDVPGTAYQAEDGSYRYILPDNYDGDMRWFCSYMGKTFGGKRAVSGKNANTRYSQVEILSMGEYTADMARMDDFYCRNEDGVGYILPQEAHSELGKHLCLGIVYYLDDNTEANFGTLKTDKFDDGRMHGLVMSLWDIDENGVPSEGGMTWTCGGSGYVSNWIKEHNTDFGADGTMENIWDSGTYSGYANTCALRAYNKSLPTDDNKRVKPIYALDKFDGENSLYKSPSNTSGWYWPSCQELLSMCRRELYDSGTKGRDLLDAQIGKVLDNTQNGELADAIKLGTAYRWSSTESSSYSDSAWVVDFDDGSTSYGRGSKSGSTYRVRPVLAF